ncbi:hypothetical protein M5D96_004046 [Drosophila gunungcola]|uniref:Uncharacterized protein n=1 Tax=Drosophila gunungcola TaxID=103775 RepID=A0A9P9YT76_9MUSC|nr:hypothetical protein M5D96_004046 [Drosophila gunungcola]
MAPSAEDVGPHLRRSREAERAEEGAAAGQVPRRHHRHQRRRRRRHRRRPSSQHSQLKCPRLRHASPARDPDMKITLKIAGDGKWIGLMVAKGLNGSPNRGATAPPLRHAHPLPPTFEPLPLGNLISSTLPSSASLTADTFLPNGVARVA